MCQPTISRLPLCSDKIRDQGKYITLRKTFDKLPVGHITTIAGVAYREGAEAKETHVGWPIGIARNNDGDWVVVDWHGNRLWRIDSDGILHSFAGTGMPGNTGDSGPATDASLNQPYGLSLYGDDILLISDYFNNQIKAVKLS